MMLLKLKSKNYGQKKIRIVLCEFICTTIVKLRERVREGLGKGMSSKGLS